VTDSAEFAALKADDEDLGDLLLEVLPGDGSTMGNLSTREALGRAVGRQISEEEYESVKDKALLIGTIKRVREETKCLVPMLLRCDKLGPATNGVPRYSTNQGQNPDRDTVFAVKVQRLFFVLDSDCRNR